MFSHRRNSRDHSLRCSAAFSLIELVVALVLSALLMVLVLGVLRRSFLSIEPPNGEMVNAFARTQLIEQLRRDLTNARQIQIAENAFELQGFIERDPLTLICSQRLAVVRYEVRVDAKESLLVRVQFPLASQNNFGAATTQMTEPIYAGLNRIIVSSNEIGALTAADRLGELDRDPDRNSQARDRIPSSVRIAMFDQFGNVVIDESFYR